MSSSLQSLIRLMEARLLSLRRRYGDAESAGDADAMSKLEAEITDAENTLDSLRTLE